MYSKLSKYYDDIFKPSSFEKQLIDSFINNSDKMALDIGAGTGKTSFHLASMNLFTIGIDLDEFMINKAISNSNYPNLEFKVMNMVDIKKLNINNFDIITCLGNTLVHIKDVNKFINNVYQILNKNGRFILQILNYDRIIKSNIKNLPQIETDNIIFNRNYHYSDNPQLINFETEIILKRENEKIVDSVTLYPIYYQNLINIVSKNGFRILNTYGSYKCDPFEIDTSFHLIVVLEK